MDRLLFAAARGARIQNEFHNWSNGGNDWREADLNRLVGARIHPEDEHLQYGPISTALREKAEFGPLDNETLLNGSIKWYAPVQKDEYGITDPFHRSLFLLILAEALADEGM